MIRIQSIERGSQSVVSIAGKLDAEHVAEVEALCDAPPNPPVLDLVGLQDADDTALRWLREFLARGGLVTRASPYIRLKLERVHGGAES